MQSVTSAIQTSVNALAAIDLDVLDDSGTSLGLTIQSASYEASCNGGDTFSLGNACSAILTLTADGDQTALKGEEVSVVWSLVGGETTYPLITGTVTDVYCSAGRSTIEIGDAMYVAGANAYVPSASVAEVSCTPYDVYQDLCDKLGVDEDEDTADALEDLSETFSSGITEYWASGELSISECCGQLALLLSADAIISRENTLVFKTPATVSFSATTYSGGGEVNPDYTVNYITVQTPEDSEGNTDEYTYPDGVTGTGLLLQSPFASDDLAERIYTAIGSLSWKPGSYEIPGGLLIEPGDIISVTTEDIASEYIHASVISMSYDGGIRSTIESAGEDSTSYGAVGSVNTAMKALTADLISANKLIADKADIADVAIYKDSDGNAVINYDGALTFETGQLVINSDNLTLDEDGNAKFKGEIEAISGTFESNNYNLYSSTTLVTSSSTATLSTLTGKFYTYYEIYTEIGDGGLDVDTYDGNIGIKLSSSIYSAMKALSSDELAEFDIVPSIESYTIYGYDSNGDLIDSVALSSGTDFGITESHTSPGEWLLVNNNLIDSPTPDSHIAMFSANITLYWAYSGEVDTSHSYGSDTTYDQQRLVTLFNLLKSTQSCTSCTVTFSLAFSLYRKGESISIENDSLSIKDSNRDTVITLDSSGAEFDVPVTVDEDLDVTGNATVGGTLGVTGAIAGSSTLATTGNIEAGNNSITSQTSVIATSAAGFVCIYSYGTALRTGLYSNGGGNLINYNGSDDCIYVAGGKTLYLGSTSYATYLRGSSVIIQGAVTTNSSLIVEGHSSAIGSAKSTSYTIVSVASGTVTQLASLTLDAGTWLVRGQAAYEANATGYRAAAIYPGQNTAISSTNNGSVYVGAASGERTAIQSVVTYTLTAQTTVYFLGKQSSGSTLSTYAGLYAVRIA